MAWRGIFNRRWWRSWQRGNMVTLLFLLTAPSFAADPVLARVVAIDHDRVTVIIPDSDARIEVVVTADEGAAQFSPDQLVRFWPSGNVDRSGVMHGARLTPLDHDATVFDRTGVRARLMRGAAGGHGPPVGRRGGR